MGSEGSKTSDELVTVVYGRLANNVALFRERLDRPLTLVEKILLNHLAKDSPSFRRGESSVELYPDRVILQDATAQMALLQFITAGLEKVAVPTSVHCDHLVQAHLGAGADLPVALQENAEVYEFLRSVSAKYGIGFWQVGAGIIHQVVLEQYAFPGGVLIGADSHSPHAGGLGMIAIGAGGAEAVDVMAGSTFDLRWPQVIGVELRNELNGWASAKDVILKVADILTTTGGTGAILEYFGDGARTISATGKATICNMGAELGATCSIFPYDDHADSYLRSVGRGSVADLACNVIDDLRADLEVEAKPRHYFDRLIELDLAALEPHIVGPHSPDLARPVSQIGIDALRNGWPLELSACLVGSCTNSSYEDIGRAAHVARQAKKHGIRVKTPLFVTPGSERVRATVERDGLLADLEAIGATVLANACGPCIGQWKRDGVSNIRDNSILTSYNRNFPKRNDGNSCTHSFIASPETVVAYALAGTLNFNPLVDTIDGVALEAPIGDELPYSGFSSAVTGFVQPPENGGEVEIEIRPNSDRLELLEPFPAWDGADFSDLVLLLKASGKCTTDQISPGGPWMRYRGHLGNISGNLFQGVVNAFSGEIGHGRCPVHGVVESLSSAALHCREAGLPWLVVGDENFGEGSSREHAAMEPRFLGAKVVIARSFARIAETNLKKQGILPLTFADSSCYDAIGELDRVSVLNLARLAPGELVRCLVTHPDGTTLAIECAHTMSETNIEWFRAGSALNLIRSSSQRSKEVFRG